jgi:DNA-directed RNA polymerase specialized sigma24 family protein
MTKAARSIRSDAEADDAWKAALEGDRKAFQAAVRPYLGELLRAARHEVRYRVALGDFRKDEPTAEELAGEVLIRGWQQRPERTPALRLRVWLLAVLYRVAHDLSRREARQKRIPAESL